MWMMLIQTVFYISIGLALFGAVVWYVGAVSTAVAGGGELVIVPFTIATGSDEKDGRGAALAKMLQARLQEIEHDLAIAQEQLMHPPARTSPIAQSAGAPPQANGLTSVVPMLFAAQGAALQTRLLEPAQVKIAVGGVEVGGLIPWFQRLLVNRRTLEFTYYEREAGVVVSGSLEPLGLPNEALRVGVPRSSGKAVDLDEVATTIAAEIVRRRLAGDASNRVEALTTAEFLELTAVLNDATRLNRQVVLGRLVRDKFAALLTRVQPLATEVREWYQLQLLAASIADSAGKPADELTFLTNARRAIEAQLKDADRRTKGDLEQQIASIDGRTSTLQPKAAAASQAGEKDARTKIEEDLARANNAFNQLFAHNLKPMTLELLAPHESNAYSDQRTYHAPPAVAQLPELTWHSASFAHLNEIVPVFTATNEANAVIYAYSDILPVAIRQLGLVESREPKSWDVYAGAVAWLEAALQGRDFKLGDDNRPLRSLKNPGGAYDDQVLGKDPQIAHYKDYKPGLEVHAAAGVGGKAFYEAASRVGVKRAVEIWIAGLREAAKVKPLTYQSWATALAEVSGAERPALVEALRAVGLAADEAATAPATGRRKTS